MPVRAELVRGLARAAGPLGMCGGQMLDLLAEHEAVTLEAVAQMQARKTGALIAFAVDAGCILGAAAAKEREALAGFARALGLAFQIRDDLLDLAGDAGSLGKAVGQDARRGKATFVAHLGRDGRHGTSG